MLSSINHICRRVVNFEISKRFAGHSKWANIRHIKAEKDSQKSVLFQKLGQRMKLAIQEGGSANPQTNFQLAQVLEVAKRSNMPATTIDNIIKLAQADKSKTKGVWFEVKGPKGCMMIVSALTDNPRKTREMLSPILRKNNGSFVDHGGRHVFEAKGVIIAKRKEEGDAEEHAIEAGAEEIHPCSEGLFRFICSMDEMQHVISKLEGLGYVIEESDFEFLPKVSISLSEEDEAIATTLIQKIYQHPDVVRLFHNIAS